MKSFLFGTLLLCLGLSTNAQSKSTSIFKDKQKATSAINQLLQKVKGGKVYAKEIKILSGKDILARLQKDNNYSKIELQYITQEVGDWSRIQGIWASVRGSNICDNEPNFIIIGGDSNGQTRRVLTSCGLLRCRIGSIWDNYTQLCPGPKSKSKSAAKACMQSVCTNIDGLCCVQVFNFEGNCKGNECKTDKDCSCK